VIHVKRLATWWSTKSPDPRGITYDRRTGKLIISDSEVDEGPLWRGKNLFIVGKKGRLIRAGTLKRFTIEPEDVALNDATGALFVVDDDQDRVFRVRPGRDGKLGTADDRANTVLHTARFGAHHPQGLAFVAKRHMLIVSDSNNSHVYEIRPGRDGRFDTRDDVRRSFGLGKYGFTNVDGVAIRFKSLFMVSSRQDFIVVTDFQGRLIRKIDLSGTGIVAARGRKRGAYYTMSSSEPQPEKQPSILGGTNIIIAEIYEPVVKAMLLLPSERCSHMPESTSAGAQIIAERTLAM
jgi:hypothetical protein